MIRLTKLTRQIWTSAIIICVCASAQAADFYSITGNGYRAEFESGTFSYYSQNSRSADLEYKLESVSLGEDLVIAANPELRKDGNIVSIRYGSNIEETYTAQGSEIEQCWLINARPRSQGSIIIRAKMHTKHYATSSSSGLSFRNERGHAVCNYGSVTVIDSIGRTYKCLPKLSGERLTITIPADYIRRAVFPILIDPVIGPETPISPTYSAAPLGQDAVELATDGRQYLAVWNDSRGTNGMDIFASRVAADGTVIDKAGIGVCTYTTDQTDPAVAWNGRYYFVVWSDKRNGTQHIYGARVMVDGQVIDKQGMLLSGTYGVQAFPRVASDGGGFQVVWQDSRGSSLDVYGCRVTSDGVIGRTYGLVTRTDNEQNPDVAWTGTTFVVTWTDMRNSITTGSDIYGCKVARNGLKQGADFLVSSDSTGLTAVSGDQKNARLCSTPSGCMVIWEDYRNGTTNSDIYGTRLASTGSVLNPGGIGVCLDSGYQELCGLGYNGTGYLAAWRNKTDRTVKGARINSFGTVTDPMSLTICSSTASSGGVAVAGFGDSFLVSWGTLEIEASDICSSIVAGSGSVMPATGSATSLGLDDQQDYYVADNGTDYLVVWSQKVEGTSDILAAKISRSGEIISEVVNLTHGLTGEQVQPSVAWNGTKYLVVWKDNSNYSVTMWDVKGMFVSADLVPASVISVITASGDQNRPNVASNGSGFLVTFEDSRNATAPNYYCDIYGALVTSTGSVTALTTAICSATGNQLTPIAASNYSGYYVVWEDYRTSGAPRIYGSTIANTGTIGANTAMPQTNTYEVQPKICYGGGQYFVTWSDGYSIGGCRVSNAGIILDAAGIKIDTGTKYKSNPSLCWDGSKYLFTWEDYRSTYYGNSDIYYGTVSSTGVVSAASKMALITNILPDLKPTILAQSTAGALFYLRLDNYVNELHVVSLTDQPAQEVASIGAAKNCASGTIINLTDRQVTGAYNGYFYMEDPSRICGIKVVSSTGVAVGALVNVTGTIGVTDGERQIAASSVSMMGVAGDPLGPLGIRGDFLGGIALNAHTPGVTGGMGPHNLGLLVTTWGKVSSTDSNGFYLEAKPGVNIHVKCPSLTKPTSGKLVYVTGINACEIVSGAIKPMILPREQEDIVQAN